VYVCNCNGITEREIREAISLGSRTFGDLRRDLGVATCCGKCEHPVRRLVRQCTGRGRPAQEAATACAGD